MQTHIRRVLVFAPHRQSFRELCDSVKSQSWIESHAVEGGCIWQGKGLRLQIDVVDRLQRAVERLHSGYYNLVMIDARHVPDAEIDVARQSKAMFRFLDVLGNERDIERRYPLRRVAALVGDADDRRADELLFQLGKRHIGACLRDHSLAVRPVGGRKTSRGRFVELIWEHCSSLLIDVRRGKRAISLAGGGITGIFHEVGVLKCLHDAFDVDLRSFDMFLGISGGAVIASCLANGIGINDIIAKIGDIDETWKYRLRLTWRQLNVLEVPKRVFLLQREVLRYAQRMLRREDELSVASIMGLSAVLLGPIFDNAQFEKALRELFENHGETNDFRKLRRELYIGVTDQDRREHVLMGDLGFDDVPISQAVQASAAMHPFFPSVEIKGRRYTDGIVTRTSNLRAAIDHGADLVFVIDPFVPLISDQPGFNARHGNMWIVEQDYKTMSHTRFARAREELLRSDPHVNTYSFVPSNRMRRYMAKHNPFISRNFHPIVCAAYRSTFRRLKTIEYKIRGELESHGIHLDLAPVRAKVQALREARKPRVEILLDRSLKKRSRVA